MNRATVGAVGALVVVGLGVGLALGHKTEVQIHLRDDGSGCKAAPVEAMSTGRLKRKLRWTVYNDNCAVPQYVSLRNFKPDGTGTPENDVVDPYPVDGGPISQGQSSSLDAKANKFPALWKQNYKYDVYIGASAATVALSLDPDIDVWPF
jgi:hypothetical protein